MAPTRKTNSRGRVSAGLRACTAKSAKKPRKPDGRGKKDKLREADLLYHTLFDQSPDGIVILDTCGNFIHFNEAAHRQLGYTRKEFEKLRVSDIDPVEGPEDVRGKIQKIIKTGGLAFEVKHRTKDGDVRDVHVISKPLAFSGRTAIHTIWRDITEHKRADQALAEINTNLQALINAIPDLVIFKDDRGRHLIVNDAVEKFLDLPREALLGRTNEELLPPALSAQCRQSDEAAMQGAKPTQCEERMAGAGGREIYLDTIKAPIRDERGKPKGLVTVSRDVTGRKRMEEALRRSEEFIRDILETVDEGFIVIDRDYRIVSANKAYLDQVKLPLEEVIGRHCFEISHRFTKRCHELGEKCPVQHSLDRGEPSTALHIHHDRDDNPVYVETKSYPLKDQSGHTVSAIEIILNTTEKKRLEAQLRHSQKMEAVGQLAGGIAHDFNNILTAITGYGSLMAAKLGKDGTLSNYLQQVLDSAQRAAKLTQGLLAFSRKQVISPRPISINTTIERVEKLLHRIIGEDIEMQTLLAACDLVVTADSSQLEQVLMNLAANARDAMPEGGYLTVTTERYVMEASFENTHGYGKPGAYALITVSDTGLGMDKKTRERIFEPFFTTKPVGKGSGLGLSIVYGIVKQHEGYITCYSEPGKGSTFRIYLPLIDHDISTANAGVSHRTAGGRETILLAEDDDTVRALMKDMLMQAGYTVLEAVDGESAIGVFANNREKVDLLILDVIMPKKNGKEVYDAIRKERPEVGVIFSSGYTADILYRKGVIEGEVSFIAKPLVPAELLQLVRATLDKNLPS